jgi:3-hydroxy-9,10-secoandrosta-1,3,5(10)-triene-9,17-dione monooxygenase reductase component
VSDHQIDSRQFRTALGSFATGVTIVTTRAADGSPVGLTANSFNSLSLEPPMVLWALAKNSLSLPAFAAAEYFAVHILSVDQQQLADRFARRGADKFGGLELDAGPGGMPLLRGCSARFQCRTAHQYDGGDHTIFVGEVIGFDHFERAPLAFQGGAYANLVPRPRAGVRAGEMDAGIEGSFSRDFLGYLLGSAHARLMACVRSELERYRLSEEHYHVLMFLSNEDDLTLSELAQLTQLADRHVTYQTLASLVIRDLITVSGGDYPSTRARLTAEGHRVALELGVALKAAEAHAERFLGSSESQTLKMMLRAILDAIPSTPPAPAGDEH